MPCFNCCRENLYHPGFFDGRTENKPCICAGVASYVGTAGCIGAVVAFSQASLNLSDSASVLLLTGSGLGIGTTLVLGSVCLAYGIEGYRESRTNISSMNWPNDATSAETINPLEHISPPHQPQMTDVVTSAEHHQIPPPSNDQPLNLGHRDQCDPVQMLSSSNRFFNNTKNHSTTNGSTFAEIREHNDELPPSRRTSFSSVNSSDTRIPLQRQRSISAPI